jgi:D-alanyl-D-alanine-carboxypeptidase/D-alanyl-D-alanine-endopeptidase
MLRTTILALSALAAQAHAVDMTSTPKEIAAAALGTQPGSAAVGIARGAAASFGEAGATGVTAGAPVLYEIGSISKVFTGLLLAQAVEKGDLSLDDKLGKLLPGQTMQPDVAAITLRQLITHSSCLPRLPPGLRTGETGDPYSAVDRAALMTALGNTKLRQAPPCVADYSNYGVGLVGDLLSMHYKKSWEELVKERIAAPVGMKNTLQALGERKNQLAAPYRGKDKSGPWEFAALSGAGGLRSTTADMVSFGRALLAGRRGPLGAAAERALQPLGRMDGNDIGYAILMRGPADHRTYFHNGATNAYKSWFMFMPDTKEVLTMLTSNGEAPIEKVANELMAARYPLAKAPAKPYVAADPGEAAGVYRLSPRSAYTFVEQDKVLYSRSTSQWFNALTPTGPDTFVHEASSAQYVFKRENGKIVGVTLNQRGAQQDAARTAEAAPAVAKVPGVTKEGIAGFYRAAMGEQKLNFEVVAEDGQMRLRLNDQPMLPVYPVAGKPDRFAPDNVPVAFQFERGADQAFNALVLMQGGQEIRAVRDMAQ